MSKHVRPYQPTWLDKAFAKDYKKLSRAEQHNFTRRLGELIEALRACAHPAADPALGKWRPSAYRIAGRIEGHLVEYRFPGTVRVIACYFEADPGQTGDSTILLVAATLKHDHKRLKRLIEGQSSGLRPTPEGRDDETP